MGIDDPHHLAREICEMRGYQMKDYHQSGALVLASSSCDREASSELSKKIPAKNPLLAHKQSMIQ
jgi:hypothetical protein